MSQRGSLPLKKACGFKAEILPRPVTTRDTSRRNSKCAWRGLRRRYSESRQTFVFNGSDEHFVRWHEWVMLERRMAEG